MNNKVIAITLFRRPRYAKLLLDSLTHAYGIEDYTVLISCDYTDYYQLTCKECINLANAFSAAKDKQVIVHDPRLGPGDNHMFVMNEAFKLSDYVVALEEDHAVSPDALRFFEFCGETLKDDPKVFSVCGYNRYTDPVYHQRIYQEHPYSLEFFPGRFCWWGMGLWKDRWEPNIGDGSEYRQYKHLGGLDWWFTSHLQLGQGLYRPILPRVQCTGGEDAVHTPNDQWHKEWEYNAFGAWDFDMPDPDPSVWCELVDSTIMKQFQEVPHG
jgi:hypothetical protein